MVWYGWHRKQCIQQFVIATGTSLPSCHLAMMEILRQAYKYSHPTNLLFLVFVAMGMCLLGCFLARCVQKLIGGYSQTDIMEIACLLTEIKKKC
jgi:hypothetical protein